jgi:long-chain acyl-CoA synthetase
VNVAPVTSPSGRALQSGTLVDVYFDGAERSAAEIAMLRRRPEGGWREYRRDEVTDRIRQISLGLLEVGIERGDRVAIMAHTGMDWAMADWAILLAGAVVVTVYPTLPPEQIAFILRDSGARLLFAGDRELLGKLAEVRDQVPEIATAVLFDSPAVDLPGLAVLSLDDLAGRGESAVRRAGSWESDAKRTQPSDLATLIYTSGTTGSPKGVMLTHANLHANTYQCMACLPIGPSDRILSWLPLSHAFERTAGHFLMWAAGAQIAYTEGVDFVARDMTEVHPTIMTGVPRLFEKFYDAVVEAVEAGGPTKKAGFRLAKWFGDLHAEKKLAGEQPGALLTAAFRLSDRIVFSKLRERTGGRIRFFVSGAAPLSPEIARFFYSGDLVILEGYGLTESSPVTNVNPPEDIRFGTVGPPIPGTRIRIADDGEILMKGPQIMKGYFGDAAATKNAIDSDGWLHSGDIGHLDDDGYLTITDRKKNLIVTAAGKNIAPQPIEERIARSPFVEQVVVLGDKRKFPIMLVVPSFQAYRVALPGKIVKESDRHQYRDSRSLRELIESDIAPRIAGLARYERPKRTLIVTDTFSVSNGMLTPTLKIKRREIAARYADRIDQLYAEAEADAPRS